MSLQRRLTGISHQLDWSQSVEQKQSYRNFNKLMLFTFCLAHFIWIASILCHASSPSSPWSWNLGEEFNIRPNKKVCVFPVSRSSLFFSSDPKTFYCVLVSNHQILEIDSYVFLLKVVWWLVLYACKALHKQQCCRNTLEFCQTSVWHNSRFCRTEQNFVGPNFL